jgi:dienelactone hydrolase
VVRAFLESKSHESSGSRIFHGGLGRDAARVNNLMRVLVLHGADDLYVPAAEVTAFQQEMRYESRLGNDLLR